MFGFPLGQVYGQCISPWWHMASMISSNLEMELEVYRLKEAGVIPWSVSSKQVSLPNKVITYH